MSEKPQRSGDDDAPAPVETPSGKKIWTVGTLKYTTPGLVALCALLLWGDFSTSMKDRSVGPVFQVMLNLNHSSDTYFALLASTIPAFLGIFLTPIIAYKSDRHRGEWGRRIPFILVPLPFISICIASLAYAPQIGSWLHGIAGPDSTSGLMGWLNYKLCPKGSTENLYALLSFGFFWVIYEIAVIIGSAVFGGLINDIVPHAVLGRFYGMWRAVSLICGMIFNWYLMDSAKSYYFETFIGTALLFGFGFGAVCFLVKEGEYPPPPPPGPHGVMGFVYGTKKFFVECFTIPFYYWYFLAGIIGGLAFTSANLYAIPFALSMHVAYGKCITLTFFISLCLSYPLGWLVDRVHPLPLCVIIMFVYMVSMLWGGLVSGDPDKFAIALIAHGVLSGTYFTVSASLGMRLLPKASFAQFSAAGGLIGHAFTLWVPLAIGYYLDSIGHVYRYTYLLACVFSGVGAVLLLFVYLKFVKLGGPHHYVAPDRNV